MKSAELSLTAIAFDWQQGYLISSRCKAGMVVPQSFGSGEGQQGYEIENLAE